MTPDERTLVQQFLRDLGQTQATKDPEADAMIADTLRRTPDAGYLLVQHAILADQALHAAQAQIEDLQRQDAPPQPAAFLGGGDDGGRPWSNAPPTPPASPLSRGGGLNGFLRSAGTMAAGVAAGDFLVQGLSNLFGPRDW